MSLVFRSSPSANILVAHEKSDALTGSKRDLAEQV